MLSPRYRQTDTGVAVIPRRGWLHMYSCIGGPGGATIDITVDGDAMPTITVGENETWTDFFGVPARQVLEGPLTITIAGATRSVINWFEP